MTGDLAPTSTIGTGSLRSATACPGTWTAEQLRMKSYAATETARGLPGGERGGAAIHG
jgi:hypothetical protein